MDIRVYDLAYALLDELTAALAHTRAGAPDLAVVHPGGLVPQYGCSVAAVRVVSILAVDAAATRCPPDWQVIYEMTVDRCYTTPADNGMPPLPTLDSAARDALEDAGAMRKAAVCAWPRPQLSRPGTWTPRGPAGGIHGGAMQVTAHGLTLTCACDADQWGNGIDSRIPPISG